MKILFDDGTPAPLRNHLREHSVDRSAEKGWELLENGELIRKAEEEGYKVIVTTDQRGIIALTRPFPISRLHPSQSHINVVQFFHHGRRPPSQSHRWSS